MIRHPPRSTRTDTLCPDTTLFRSDRSKAVFGNLSFKLLDNLKLNAGYRHTWDREGVCAVNTRPFFGDPIRSYGECLATAGSFADSVKFDAGRSEERRVGTECVSTCRSRWSPDH